MTRRWTINGRFLTQPLSGVQRYGREIVAALDRLVVESHPLTRGMEITVSVPSGVREALELQAIELDASGNGTGHAWEQFVLPAHVSGGLLSLCNTGPIVARRHIVCIHDANTRTCPSSYALPFRALYRGLLPMLGRRAAAVTTVSSFSASEIARWRIAPVDKISVVPNGHEHALAWAPRHTPSTEAVAGPGTIVVIGSNAPHKNIEMLIGLAPKLKMFGLRLAITGLAARHIFRSDGGPVSADNIAWLGRVGDGQLAALLQDSLCLAFPSLSEGFGLPPLEAMARGCPVVVSDQASLPEVCGDAALYASPHNPAAWLATFVRLRDKTGLRADRIARGLHRSRQFSWRSSALLYLEAMQRIDCEPRTRAKWHDA
jgi:glycosyltransferase involved in cell wall biosynthesis